MKTKSRNILLILGSFTLFFVAILIYGAYSLYSFYSQFLVSKDIPNEIKEARVLVGRDFLDRKVFFSKESAGLLKTIGDSSQIKDEKERQKMIQSEVAKGIYNFADLKVVGEEIVAVAEFGGYFFDLNGNLKKHITFDPVVTKLKIGPYEQDTFQSGLSNLQIIGLDKDRIGFISFGSTDGARVFDANGSQIWSTGSETADLSILFKDEKGRTEDYEKKTYVLEAAVGDLDNDGKSEFVVARNADGIRAYDQNGVEKWFQPADFPSKKLVICDLDGDGKAELLEIGDSVRDGNGKFIRKMKSGESKLFVEGKNRSLRIQSLNIYEGFLTLVDEDNVTVISAKVPLSEIKTEARKVDVPGNPEISYVDDNESVSYPKGVWVKLRNDKPKYLAVVASFIGIPRANLYIFEPNGNLVYHELLGEEAKTIALVPAVDGKEQLLVGGKDSIWRYAAN